MTTSRRPSKLNDQLEDRGPFETRPLPRRAVRAAIQRELTTRLYLAKATEHQNKTPSAPSLPTLFDALATTTLSHPCSGANPNTPPLIELIYSPSLATERKVSHCPFDLFRR